MKTHLSTLLLLAAILGSPDTAPAEAARSLAGTWRLSLDRDDVGLGERWYDRTLPEQVTLPGSLAAQGIGDDVSTNTPWVGGIVDRAWFTAPEYAKYREPGNVKVPYWLQPEKHYAGPAWYQRDIEIPQEWADRRVVLFLERAHWETRVWVGDRPVGTNHSLATPHEYDLGRIPPGRHTLTIRVDNRMIIDIGENSHAISDHTQGNWNGIVGRIELRTTPLVWIEDVQVYPHASTRSVMVKGRIGNQSGRSGMGELLITITPRVLANPARLTGSKRIPLEWTVEGGGFETEVDLSLDAGMWDEFTPTTYRLVAWLDEGLYPEAVHDSRGVHFGLRRISSDGAQVTLNGRKTFLRGTLECAIFPKTGHPPVDINEWRRIIRAAKSCGLNHLRFHSWCPPEPAFEAADELGMYLQVETCWPNQSTTLGDGKPVDQWVYDETDRILKAYGNHPSFVMMAHGNEPGGGNATAFLRKYVAHYKALDPRRLWTSGAGWPEIEENQFHVLPDPRIQQWGQGLSSRINAKPPETVTDYRDFIETRKAPVISHEIGQWCVYPNFEEISKYTGYLKPRNFEIFRGSLEANHMGHLAREFLFASGKLQALCYKEEIESALRTPGMGGFQLLDLHDFPGQGTALVGVMDPFWEEKGYITAKQFSRFCNTTVPLARLSRRVFTTEETLEVDAEVAHFGPAALQDAASRWELVHENGRVEARGTFPAKTIPVDNGVSLGRIHADLGSLPAPARYRLGVSVDPAGGRSSENDWDIWVYPPNVDTAVPAGITVVHELNEHALSALEGGGKVLLLMPPARVKGDARGHVALGFSSIFWNTAWTGRQPPHTLGILCDPAHPALADFPTDAHSDWQWWYLLSRAGVMMFDDLPSEVRPTVRVIDDWVSNRRLGLLFEAKVGNGGLLVCSIDLERDLDQNVVARQFRVSLLRYLQSNAFDPNVAITPAQVRGLMGEPSVLQQLGARVLFTDSDHFAHTGRQAIDTDPNTFWHTAWEGDVPGFPHELQIELQQPVAIHGVTLLPRQDQQRNGWIREYQVYVTANLGDWGTPVVRGSLEAGAGLKRIRFPQAVRGRYVRLVTLSGHGDGPWTSLAEFDLITETP